MTDRLTNKTDPNYGAIKCAHCDVLHTRAAESVFPFTVAYKITGDRKYLNAAINVGNWLIKQQEEDGSWKETPEEWTGTSTDQLLMMVLAYQSISELLNETDIQSWKSSMKKSAEYLTGFMSPENASINYVATTTATLAAVSQVINDSKYLNRAKELAHRTISKMDEDGFINGEGGRAHLNKYGVDLGYDLEMSLWGLGYYAMLTGDSLVDQYVKMSIKNHIYFIYPDGSMDASWGIRSNKWTTYGGATSDGCQVLFALYSDEDPCYASASLKNLQFLRQSIKDGIVGYGPQHWEIFNTPPCIYPTFAKAKNLAMAYELESKEIREVGILPTEKIGWIKLFKTLDVVQVRTKNFMATITSYGYEDYKYKSKSKYMYRPSGGTISNLWVKGYGFLQASSVTEYSRPEPMHFPEAPGIKSLTPRIEYTDSLGYFTNLFEFDSRIEIEELNEDRFKITTAGELKDKNWLFGGVSYKIDYLFSDSKLDKEIILTYHDAWPEIEIIEPIINWNGMIFHQIDDRTILIAGKNKKFEFKLTGENGRLYIGKDTEKYWAPYPALKAYPLIISVPKPVEGFIQRLKYSIRIID